LIIDAAERVEQTGNLFVRSRSLADRKRRMIGAPILLDGAWSADFVPTFRRDDRRDKLD
jgi:hypothetical protein